MKTLRLLFWLRWRIAMNTTSRRGRWAAVGITVVLALAFSPLYIGAAAGAWLATSQAGPKALVVVFGLAQVGSSRVDLQACKLEYSIVSPK